MKEGQKDAVLILLWYIQEGQQILKPLIHFVIIVTTSVQRWTETTVALIAKFRKPLISSCLSGSSNFQFVTQFPLKYRISQITLSFDVL
jgi:hypothetical protein